MAEVGLQCVGTHFTLERGHGEFEGGEAVGLDVTGHLAKSQAGPRREARLRPLRSRSRREAALARGHTAACWEVVPRPWQVVLRSLTASPSQRDVPASFLTTKETCFAAHTLTLPPPGKPFFGMMKPRDRMALRTQSGC